MNPEAAELLSQLRDIHSAPAVPWWPPAPGWWMLMLLLVLGLYVLGRRFARHYRRQRRRRKLVGYVHAVEAGIDPASSPQEFLSAVNRIFKLVAIEAFPGDRCARMQGREWSRFLQRHLARQAGTEQLEALASGPYQPVSRFDHGVILRLARQWIDRYG
jgi:hypothetical protein